MNGNASTGLGDDAFAALVNALAAALRQDPTEFAAALATVSPSDLVSCASRHRCSGELLRAIDELGVAGCVDRILVKQLQETCKRAAVAWFANEAQLSSVLNILREASVPVVLLKGAARLYAGQAGAHWDPLFDFDLLIQSSRAAEASAALKTAGYTQRANDPDWYLREHHHLAPLRPAGGGLAIELHTWLAPPGLMSQSFGWAELERYFEPLDGSAGTALRLNASGSALHLMIHGLGLRDSGQSWGGTLLERLRDTALLAKLFRDDPPLLERLVGIARADERQAIGLEAVLALAAWMAGVQWSFDRKALRYAQYAISREGLPPELRHRVRVADAWFGSGSRLTHAVLRASTRPWRELRLPSKVLEPFCVAGRVALGGLAVARVFLSKPVLRLAAPRTTEKR